MSPDASTFAWWLLPLLMALLTGAMAGVVGPLLVLRRRVLHSNLIAHAVLPGVALALAAGIDPLLGGLASGLSVTWLAEWLSSRRLLDDLGQEVVANTLLAASLGLGVLLIQAFDGDVDLNSLLFGDLLTAGPVELLRTSIALGMLLVLVCSRYQHLVFLAMDPEGAAAAGLPRPAGGCGHHGGAGAAGGRCLCPPRCAPDGAGGRHRQLRPVRAASGRPGAGSHRPPASAAAG